MDKSIQYLLPRLTDAMNLAQIDSSLPVRISGTWITNPPQSFFGKKYIVTATQEDKTVSVDMAQSGDYYLKKIIKALRHEGLAIIK